MATHESLDAEAIRHEHFPLYGPYAGDTTNVAAGTISELVRYLNHATQHDSALPYPSNVGDVLGGLSATVYGLDQLLRQVSRRFEQLAADPNAYVWPEDDRTAPRQQAAALADQCQQAAGLAVELGSVLNAAQEIANRVGLHD